MKSYWNWEVRPEKHFDNKSLVGVRNRQNLCNLLILKMLLSV